MKKVIGPFFEKVYGLTELKNPHNYALPDKPFIIDVELTNNCNLLCAFCDRQLMKRPKGFIDLEVFKKVADQAAKAGVLGLRLIRWGEPYLHPLTFDFIRYAKSQGLLVHITTNGLLLNEEKAKKTIESGLDNIIFSMQGTDERGYLEMRQAKTGGENQYKIFLKNIENMISLREGLGVDHPFIQVTTTTLDESKEEIDRWKNYWNRKVDLATHTGPTSFHRVRECDRIKVFLGRAKFWKREKPCNEVLTKLAVNWNGDFTACANDYDNYMILGNIKDVTVSQAWHSDKLNYYREVLKKNNQTEICKKIPYCSYCRNKF